MRFHRNQFHCIKVRYWIEPRDLHLSNKYGQKHLGSAKKSTTDAIKTASKKQFKKQQKQPVVTKLLIK